MSCHIQTPSYYSRTPLLFNCSGGKYRFYGFRYRNKAALDLIPLHDADPLDHCTLSRNLAVIL